MKHFRVGVSGEGSLLLLNRIKPEGGRLAELREDEDREETLELSEAPSSVMLVSGKPVLV